MVRNRPNGSPLTLGGQASKLRGLSGGGLPPSIDPQPAASREAVRSTDQAEAGGGMPATGDMIDTPGVEPGGAQQG